MEFHERLKKMRQHAGLYQKDVAKILGMGPNAYQRYELGSREPDLDKLSRLADLFDVPIDYLLGRGVFKDWDALMDNRSKLLQLIEELGPNFKKLQLDQWDEPHLMKLLPLLFSKITIDGSGIVTETMFSQSDFNQLDFSKPDN